MSFVELLAHPGVSEQLSLAGPFGFMAFHGGLEAGTAEAAMAAAEAAEASLYVVVQPPELRWHIPSHRVGADGSEALQTFLAHVEVGVALHGYGRPDRPRHLLVGGGNRALAAQLGRHLRDNLPDFTIVDELEQIPLEMRGLHPTNPANLPAGGGVQLELPPGVRGASPRLADRASVCLPAAGLVAALAATALGYQAPPAAGIGQHRAPPAASTGHGHAPPAAGTGHGHAPPVAGTDERGPG